MEKIKSFVKANKDRKDHVGAICTKLLNDKKFNDAETEQEFIDYIGSISNDRPELTDAVLDLKKEMGLL